MDQPTSLLPFFGVIQVTGEDASTFLHNQLSNDILHLPVNSAAYASYNTPQGRVLANMLVIKAQDSVFLILAQDLCDTIAKRLKMFVLRSKVLIENASDQWALAAKIPEQWQSTEPHTVLSTEYTDSGIWTIHLPHGGTYLFCQKNNPSLPSLNPHTLNIWQENEIMAGFPWICAATSEKCVAQMLNLHRLGAVHFKKGCYPGQEIIARAQYRGQVRRGLAVFKTPINALAGTTLLNEHKEEVGIVINSAQAIDDKTNYHLLAVVKFSAMDQPIFIEENLLQLQHYFFERQTETK
ncbi:YgfZ/GcvT domain-containing protein [Neisseria sp. Ec49-e6-T10]|uniref:CAF17-like 4Fe-4S cluster assembly/insertion protein YgfZ n=1 Tax=Neisseria sp. Ec49-e6-T10 TaxID=3140744 RepID=UPI003EB82BD5